MLVTIRTPRARPPGMRPPKKTSLSKVTKRAPSPRGHPRADAPASAPAGDATDRGTLDACRMAVAGIERLRTVLARAGQEAKLGPPATMQELSARAGHLGLALPPSYSAAMRVASRIGEPEQLLDSTLLAAALQEVTEALRAPKPRYAPFARLPDGTYVCFDRESVRGDGELAVAAVHAGGARPLAPDFGAWLDTVADTREASSTQRVNVPPALRALLVELGFTLDDPLVARLETADVDAIRALIGPAREAEVRGAVGRLFDSSGKASLALNLDELTLAISLRTGIYVFEPEEVFRWLRTFRDESFFGKPAGSPALTAPRAKAGDAAPSARDLRRAPREAPLVQRGVMEVLALPARRHTFRAAAGRSTDDFFLLGRTSSTSERAPSLLIHVVSGVVCGAHSLDEPLVALHVTRDGTVWALSQSAGAIRFSGGLARAFPLPKRARGRTWWSGIGGDDGRVLVWGVGALLEFDGNGFVPFSPDAKLEDDETVVALEARGPALDMLVSGDRVGAVAHFDGAAWSAIGEADVIEGTLVDMDSWRGAQSVLTREGALWHVERGAPPRRVPWDTSHEAFQVDAATPRPLHALRAQDGVSLVATDGGVVSFGRDEPVFHASPSPLVPARLARVGPAPRHAGAPAPASEPPSDGSPGVVAMCGPNAWIWRRDAFYVIDLREW